MSDGHSEIDAQHIATSANMMEMAATSETTSALDQAANEAATSPTNDRPEPTEAQKEAGNYKKGKVRLHGLDISIENPKGSTRKGKDQDGKEWSSEMKHHYGDIKGTTGADGDSIDVFIGDKAESQKVFVVDQIDPKTGEFDEVKVMMGFDDAEAAKSGYLSNYDKNWKGLGEITEASVEDFKAWTKRPRKSKQPFALPVKPKKEEAVAKDQDDWGKKITTARKNISVRWNENSTDEEISSKPLSKTWPEKEFDDVGDTYASAFAFAARGEIPRKPNQSYKKQRWVEKVKNYRQLVKDNVVDGLLTGKITKEKMKELGGKRNLQDFFAKVDLLSELDRKDWGKVERVLSYPDSMDFNPKTDKLDIPNPKAYVRINGRNREFNSTDPKVLAEQIRPFLEEKVEKPQMKFEVRGRKGSYFINKKGDPEYTRLATFDSSKEAFDFIKNNNSKLVESWESHKARVNVTKADIRNKVNKPRTGEDYRNGKNATAEDFQNTFGIKRGTFGKWVKQGKERQDMLNGTYDALMDLANITGVPPRALSLEGKLGFAFGANGRGKAMAHYEPGEVVINLTKTKGAGSLAHEWFHALDNYFQKKRDTLPTTEKGNFITHNPETYYIGPRGYSVPESRFRDMRGINKNEWRRVEGVRPEVATSFKNLVDTLNGLDFAKRSSRLDKGKAGGYWSSNLEMAARAFESYVKAKMSANGYDNDFLANVTSDTDFVRDDNRYPYIKADEIAEVEAAFDDLFNTIESKESDNGDVALFRQGDGPTKTKVKVDGKLFETGKPVTFPYLHNKDSATKMFGIPDKDSPFGRGYEPSAKYVTYHDGDKPSYGDFEAGEITFNNPLVIDNDNLNWKQALSESYGGKTGKALSKAIIKDGFDGIVTVDGKSISEIVDLTTFDESKALFSAAGTVTSNTNTSAVSRSNANEIVSRFVKGLSSAGKNYVSVVSTYDDLPTDIKDAAKAQGAEYQVKGVFHKGKVHVVLDQHTSALDMETTLFHEAYGHLGIKNLFGDDITKKLNSLFIANGGLKGLRETAKRHGINLEQYIKGLDGTNMPQEVKNRVLMDELLAHMQQSNKPSVKRLAREIVGIIRQKLRDLGLASLAKVSDSDLFYLLKQVRKAAQRGPAKDKQALFMFGGKNAKKFDKNSPSNFVDSEGVERFKFDDSKAKLKKPISEGDLVEDVLDHPELFENYPQLKDIKLRIIDSNSIKGSFNESSRTIKLNGSSLFGSEKATVSTLLHELQHAVQVEEGVNSGSNSSVEVPEWKRNISFENTPVFYDFLALAEKFGGEFNLSPSDIMFNYDDAYSLVEDVEVGANKSTELTLAQINEIKEDLSDSSAKAIDDNFSDPDFYDEDSLIEVSELFQLIGDRAVEELLPIIGKSRYEQYRENKGEEEARQVQSDFEASTPLFRTTEVSAIKKKQQDFFYSKKDSILDENQKLDSEFRDVSEDFEDSLSDSEYDDLVNGKWTDSVQIPLNEKDFKAVASRVNSMTLFHGSEDTEIDSLELRSNGALFLTSDKSEAESYAGDDGRVYQQKVRINNPFVVETSDVTMDMESSSAIDEIKALGYDSIVPLDYGNIVILNNGTYDLPLFRTTDDAATFSAPVENKWSKDWFKRKLQDKFAPIKDMQASIEKATGRELPEDQNAYRAEELFYGKTENDLNKMEKNHVKPLVDAMTSNNIDSAELDQFLIAKHARERNAHIASINPEMQDGGSGMTNAEADAILSRYEQEGKLRGLEAAASEVYKITQKRRELMRDAGLEDESLLDVWDATYEFYVPLKGYAEDSEGNSVAKTGSGFDIRGKESMRAMGRRTIAESPTAHAIQDLSATIIRSRKNEVGRTFLKMVEENPNPDIWEVFTEGNPDTERRIVNGEVKENQPIDMRSRKDDYFSVKVDGQSKYIKLKDKDGLLMKAMKNMGPEQMNTFTRSMSEVTRWLSMVNTSLNPEFTVTNFTRDIQTALFNALAEQDLTDGKVKDKAIAMKMIKGSGKAVKSLWQHSAGKLDEADPMFKWIEEFLSDGAKTGYFDSKEVDKIGTDLADLLDMANGTNKGKLLKAKHKIGDFIESVNGGIENGVRLSAYIEAREAGVTREKAASFAKNLTVNFNRKGEIGTFLNSLYMFFNAAVQGNANFARAIITPKVDEVTGKKSLNMAQKVAVGISLASFGWAALMREMAGDDEDDVPYWDKIPKGVRERNFIIPKTLWGGEPGEYVKIPLPYGYNIFYNLGDAAEAAINSDTRKSGDLAAEMALSVYASFVPLGSPVGDNGAESIALVAAPTITKPIVELATNKNFFGGPIYRENNPYGAQLRDSQMSMRSTGEAYKWMAGFMNDVIGDGRSYKVNDENPWYDVSPDSIEHLVEFSLGGLYRFGSRIYDNVAKSAQGGELESTDIPFARQLNGKVKPYADITQFYEARQQLKNIDAEMDSLRGKERLEFRKEYGDKLRLQSLMSSLDKRMKQLRKQRDRVEINESLSYAEKEKRLQKIEDQMKTTAARFNKQWNKVN